MSTTALRIELLIIGFQASIWVILLFAGFESSIEFYKSNSNEIKETAAVIVLITLAWCYSLGAMVDGITAIFEDPKSLLRSNSEKDNDSSSEKDNDSSSEKDNGSSSEKDNGSSSEKDNGSSFMRLKYPEAYKELITSDFELRLLRSTSFNLLLIGISLWVNNNFSVLVGVAFFGSLSVGAAWHRRKNKTKLRRQSLYAMARKLS